MKNCLYVILFIGSMFLVNTTEVSAQRGCCSHHGGVAGCSSSGRPICNDGTLSPSCTCTPTVTYTYWCTDEEAKNYNKQAEKEDDSCEYYIYGCIDEETKNYNEAAEKSDDSCEYFKYGCTNSEAINYDENAEKDDGTCEYKKMENESDDGSALGGLITIGCAGAGYAYYKVAKQKK